MGKRELRLALTLLYKEDKWYWEQGACRGIGGLGRMGIGKDSQFCLDYVVFEVLVGYPVKGLSGLEHLWALFWGGYHVHKPDVISCFIQICTHFSLIVSLHSLKSWGGNLVPYARAIPQRKREGENAWSGWRWSDMIFVLSAGQTLFPIFINWGMDGEDILFYLFFWTKWGHIYWETKWDLHKRKVIPCSCTGRNYVTICNYL